MSDGQGKLVMFSHAMGLVEKDAAHFHAAAADLSGLLRRSPVRLDMQVEHLPSDCVDELEATLRDAEELDGVNASVATLMGERLGDESKVLVACPPDHDFAARARQKWPGALWGVAFIGEQFGVTYNAGNKYVVWHEALHLLGAEDCYTQDKRGPTCEHTRCIMQYAPSVQTVGEWPFICARNVEIIRACNEQFHLSPDEQTH